MSIRKPIPKQVRRLVYEKYAGHCAYCGKEIKYEEMLERIKRREDIIAKKYNKIVINE